MSSFTFTPSDMMDPNKERDWAANLGMVDWDSTRIVFTKRSLIEFLKYTGTTVDTNFSNIQKVPRYAQFGKLSTIEIQESSNLPESSSASEEAAAAASGTPNPAGIADILRDGVDDDALSTAPAKGADESGLPAPGIKPSRRVRTVPGGKDSISGLFGNDDNDDTDTFKPTRRVRQGPGGQDSIAGLF